MAEIDKWMELIEETRQALVALRTEDLESLAERAASALEEVRASAAAPKLGGLGRLASRHRILGEVLESTDRNLEVLRRLRGISRHGNGGLRWVR